MQRYSDFKSLAWPQERDACGVGFVAHVGGRRSHDVLAHGLQALANLAHRGAVSADGKTGDGAGVLTQVPHRLFRRELDQRGIVLERDRDLGVGVFFAANDGSADEIYALIRDELARSPVKRLLWRDPPLDPAVLGEQALARRPVMRQVLVAKPAWQSDEEYERTLYLTRKRIERRLAEAGLGRAYVCSFSSRTISYKGLMGADQLHNFYLDLADPDYETAITVFHQRYSTNTLPRWSLAQPFRLLGHNGEINTLQGNVNFMRAREPRLASHVWGHDVRDLLPIIEAGGSDSAALDNALELLTLSGRDLLHALMMLVPQAYEQDDEVDSDLRGFYDYHATLMEPWDGPSALAMSDGRYAIAGLDRNGLRPQRYWLTDDDLLVVASEAGVLPLEEERVVERGRLGPGRLLAVDTLEGKLLRDEEIKQRYASRRPYREWVERHEVPLDAVAAGDEEWSAAELKCRQRLFGYSSEDYDRIFQPMSVAGDMPVGSMGDDTPLAALSQQPQQLYRYFKQRFAQVTNPPIDPLRERPVMSLSTVLGPRSSVLEEESEAAMVARFPGPVIDAGTLRALKGTDRLASAVLDCSFPVAAGPGGLAAALDELADAAQDRVEEGVSVLILSDRAAGAERAPLPMLLAVGAVHHRLLLVGRRTRAAIVCDTGEPREDHHYACLIGFGAALIHPYLALATARDVAAGGKGYEPLDPDAAVANYIAVVEKGLLKIMSKMGISTLASYRGAQVFETVGLAQTVVDRYFDGTPAHLGGATLEQIAADVLTFHAGAYGEEVDPLGKLSDRGIYRFRKVGEYHSLNPSVFKALHKAVRNESFEAFEEYTRAVEERPATAVRDLFVLPRAATPVPLEEVESVADIVGRFTTQAMSHGSVSREMHETLGIAMNSLGGKSNSGEGGEDRERFAPFTRDMPERSHSDQWHPAAGDHANSAIKQVASGRFGVTPEYLVHAREIEIKMAQGSKPGEGGQIPDFKVTAEIAALRRSVPGVTLISPPPHHDIYSIEDLAQLIYDLKRVSPHSRVGVKLVSTSGIGTVAAGVVKGYADNIQVSGHDGGTGASPLASTKHAGLPWELGLVDVQSTLIRNGLRERVTLRVDGGLKTGRDVVIAALLGAEEYGFGTTALVAAGCAMIRQCHLNTCPVGIATQDPVLRAKFAGKPEHVVRLFLYLAQQVRMILAETGHRSLAELIGRSELLSVGSQAPADDAPRFVALDVEGLLLEPLRAAEFAAASSGVSVADVPRSSRQRRNDRPGRSGGTVDDRLTADVLAALAEATEQTAVPQVRLSYAVTNRERSLGSGLAGELARRYGDVGLPDGAIEVSFSGVAGQSFGAFSLPGTRLVLRGEAQDYVGKSLAGGDLVIRPAEEGTAAGGVVAGNTLLYGATGGALYAAGGVGERVCVRNSGAVAVVEGCGDHGCEYMTGGTVVVLGRTGRNFAAGMSGGEAFVLDSGGVFERRLNDELVTAVRLEDAPARTDERLHELVKRHFELTGSARAGALLDDWRKASKEFWYVAPRTVAPAPAASAEGDEGAVEGGDIDTVVER